MRKLLLVVLCIALSGLTAWYVARQVVSSQEDAVSIQAVEPVSISQREVVGASEQTIAPVISANGIIVPLANDDGWMLEAPAPSDAIAYQLLDEPVGIKALIKGGPTGFDCEWIGLGYTGGSGTAGTSQSGLGVPAGATNVTLQCAIPSDIRASHGMNGMMVIQTERPQEVQALPRSAVAGTAGQGQVVIVTPEGNTEIRTVELGISDTYNIEIVSGLADNDQVLLYPVQADFAAAQQP